MGTAGISREASLREPLGCGESGERHGHSEDKKSQFVVNQKDDEVITDDDAA
jgi:hypothetical protein